jgi:tryptophanyl-tRNA synthetase
MAVGLLASGIDPVQASLFVQSDVPEHTELAWIFNTVTATVEHVAVQCSTAGWGCIDCK